MVAAMLSVITGLIILWSLWIRRHTWRAKWETASTVNVALMFVAGLLIATPPSLGSLLGTWIHTVLHLWNMQFFLASICALGGVSAIVYNAVAKLCDDHEIGPWFRTRIALPITLGSVILLSLFVRSAAVQSRHCADFFTMKTTGVCLSLYWVLYGSMILYLIYHSVTAFLDLYDAEGRGLVTIYLAASVSGALAILIRMITAIFRSLETRAVMDIAGIAALLSVGLVCGGAGYAWTRRVRWFTHGQHSADSDREYH